MPDLLVKLYDLPDDAEALRRVAAAGVTLRRAMPYDAHHVRVFIGEHFSQGWESEVLSAWARQPIPCVLALQGNTLVGFASYDTTLRGFFGPTGVAESQRGQGIGEALLHVALRSLRDMGYGYAVIGSAGPVAWYEKTVGATVIDGSEPGVYADFIRHVKGVNDA